MKIFNIADALPSGYVKDGSVDYTARVQSAIDANDVISFPDFPIMVNDRGLVIPSNRWLDFLPGAKLIQQPTSNGSHNAIRIQRVTNVVLSNPVIVGERDYHIGTSGEWGHGIAIYGSSSIKVNGANTTKCWGDGIYLAGKDGVTNTNIEINNASCTYSRRNGISITSANGLVLNSPFCGYTSGVLPMSGIDIEPSGPTDEIQNVVINSPQTTKSREYGISIGLSDLLGGADKIIDVKIINWIDSYSKAALRASVNDRKGIEKLSGTIDIINPFWKDNSIAPWRVDIRTDLIKLNLSTPTIRLNLKPDDIRALLCKKENLNANNTITF